MSKNCIHCGAELPEGAAFCPHCEKPQAEKTAVVPPRPWRKRAAIAVSTAVAVVLVSMAVFLLPPLLSPAPTPAPAAATPMPTPAPTPEPTPAPTPEPEPAPSLPPDYEHLPTELSYEGYHLLLTFYHGDGGRHHPGDALRDAPEEGFSYFAPSQLFVYREDDPEADVNAQFLELVELAETIAVPCNGGPALECVQPHTSDDFPLAALLSDARFDADSDSNHIIWVLHMKNGDVLYLRHAVLLFGYELPDSPAQTP